MGVLCDTIVAVPLLYPRLQQTKNERFYSLILCSSGNLRKFAKGSEAHIELILRKMKIYAELGRKSELDALVQSGLIDAYNETQLCTTILKTRDKLYADYFSNKT